MPYIVTLNASSLRWPDVCPFCGSSPSTGGIERTYTRLTGFWLFFATEVSGRYSTPACQACQTRARRLWFAGLGLTVLPWVLLLGAMFLVPHIVFSGPIPVGAAGAISVAGILVYVWRGGWLRRFRLSYLRDGQATFSARSEKYATAFADANGVPVKYALFVFWLN